MFSTKDQRPKAEDQRPDQMYQAAGTAGFPFGKFTNLMFRRCVLRLKSRERQLIRDNRKPVINRPINPKRIITPLPVAVRFNPWSRVWIVLVPFHPSRACTTKIENADSTILINAEGMSHFQPMSINWS